MNRTIAPAFTAPKSVELKVPQEIKLHHDISLFWIKDVKDESVKLDIEWFAGTKYQPKKLVAGFTNKLLLSGNEKKSAREISEEIDFYGGFVQDEVDKDHSAITLYGLTENFNKIFSIFEDAVLHCTFPEKEFNEERNTALTKFKIDSEKVKFIAQRAFNGALFGEHPYGHAAEIADFENLQREDLLSFYNHYYLGSKPVLFLVGNVDEKVIESIKNWTAKLSPTDKKFNAVPVTSKQGQIRIEKKDAIQSAIRVGRLAVDKKHPDYFGLQVTDTILGGYFGSRLMANIREDKGYTYGIGSAVAVLENAAYFFIATEVAKDVADSTIKEIYFEMDRLKNEPVEMDELERVKNYLLGEFLRQLDGPTAMMDSFKNIWFNKLPLTYYSDFITAIQNVTADDIMNLSKKYFDRKAMTEIIAG